MKIKLNLIEFFLFTKIVLDNNLDQLKGGNLNRSRFADRRADFIEWRITVSVHFLAILIMIDWIGCVSVKHLERKWTTL